MFDDGHSAAAAAIRAVALVNIIQKTHTRASLCCSCIHFVLHWCCCCCCRYPADISPSSLVLTWNRREHQQNRKYNRSRRLPLPSPSSSLHRWHINLVVSRNIQQQPTIWPSLNHPPIPHPHMAYVEKHTRGTFKCNQVELHSTAHFYFFFFSNFAGILIERQIFSQIDWREREDE